MFTTRYYQFGGFRPDIRWFEGDWNDKKIVDLLAGPDSPLRPTKDHPLELVLGIKRKGTSHLLLADVQASAFERSGKKRPYKFSTIDDFESVSPIYFSSADELKKKLGLLKQKQRKGKKEEPWDTSQANRSFTDGDRGILRGEFEHGRVLYRLLRSIINPSLYSIADVSWCANLRLLAFTCNLRAVDLRSYEERQQSPRPLDYGWAEADVLNPNLTVKLGSAVHLVRAEDRLLGTGRPKVSFEHGKTQVESQEQIASLVQQFFSAFQEESTTEPVVLLVYDEKLALNALHELGVPTAKWKFGIDSLLRSRVKLESSHPQQFTSSTTHHRAKDDFESRRQRTRDRSRSPTRQIKAETSDITRRPLSGRRSPPPPQRRKFAPIYVVDVRTLYRTMMQSQFDKYLGEIAQKLGVVQNGNSWCAGNEAVYLFQVWHSMVSGSAIDEQRATRIDSAGQRIEVKPGGAQQPPPVSATGEDEDEDEEFDPNDLVQVSTTSTTTTTTTQQLGGDDDDSDTDYGSDY